MSRGLIDAGAPASLPVHPMQFYLMANGLVVFLVTSAVWRRSPSRPGVTAAAFLLLYGSTRFWWEFFRDPGGSGTMVFPSTSQWMCLLLVVAGGASLWLLRYLSRAASAEPAPGTGDRSAGRRAPARR